jgi:anti-sigma28 factor (negative regulator of flagellin synthesis)
MSELTNDTFDGRKARTAKEVSDEFRNASPENERLYQEAQARHEAEATNDTNRETLDARIKAALANGELTMDDLVSKVRTDGVAVRDIKSRVMQLVPETIELTHDVTLRLVTKATEDDGLCGPGCNTPAGHMCDEFTPSGIPISERARAFGRDDGSVPLDPEGPF